MSENANDKLTSSQQIPTTNPDQPQEAKLGRRLFFFKAAAVVGGAAAVTTATVIGTATEAQAQRCTDRDPGDPRGWGRWCRRPRRVRRWCTDRDPRDARGHGRWCR
jgi:hypothetical protein